MLSTDTQNDDNIPEILPLMLKVNVGSSCWKNESEINSCKTNRRKKSE